MIAFTERAIEKVKQAAASSTDAHGKFLRVFVNGAGCSGLGYGLAFDEEREGDTVVEQGELRVLVDAESAPLLEGARVDFVENEWGSGFAFDNPNEVESRCGGQCGCQ